MKSQISLQFHWNSALGVKSPLKCVDIYFIFLVVVLVNVRVRVVATVTWPHLWFVAVVRVCCCPTAHHAFDCFAIGIDGLRTEYCRCSMEIKEKGESNKKLPQLLCEWLNAARMFTCSAPSVANLYCIWHCQILSTLCSDFIVATFWSISPFSFLSFFSMLYVCL